MWGTYCKPLPEDKAVQLASKTGGNVLQAEASFYKPKLFSFKTELLWARGITSDPFPDSSKTIPFRKKSKIPPYFFRKE